jgi:actin-related protein
MLEEWLTKLIPDIEQHNLLPLWAIDTTTQQPIAATSSTSSRSSRRKQATANNDTHPVATDTSTGMKLTDSFTIFATHETLRDIKESVCKVTEHAFDPQSAIKLPSQQYTLPDGHILDIGNERFLVGELLFRPDAVPNLFPPNERIFPDIDPHYTYHGLHKMISASIDSTDADLRRTMYENIVLSGGSTLLPGLAARLQREITNNIGPLYRVKFLTGNAISDRRYTDWLGGSILASLGSFHQMWISQAEYQEYGKSIIHRKCP